MPDTVSQHLRLAIAAAAATKPHPNPRVGARVVTTGGRVIGTGVHNGPGTAHAEIEALTQAGRDAVDATLFVTLEPCDHVGRTPPCTQAIIDAGVRRVVIAAADPDPRSGAGAARLRAAGVEVVERAMESEVVAMDPAYFHHRRTGRPLVTLKAALTLDGQLAALDGTSQWITSEAARQDAHGLRAEADAVVVGSGTVRTDDPALTVRLPGYRGPQPVPVVIAGRRPLPTDRRIFAGAPLIFAPTEQSLDAEVVVLPAGQLVDLEKAIVALGERGYLGVLVEGGATLARSLLEADLIDRAVLYYGAKLAGGGGQSLFAGDFGTLGEGRNVEIESVDRVGPDLRVQLDLKARL